MTPARVPALLLALTVALVLVSPAGPAAAHGEDGEMELLTLEPAGERSIEIEVGIVYSNDGDLAEDARVEAVLAQGNVTVGPETLARQSGGRYGARIDVPGPGSWAVRVSSSDPTAEATGDITLEAPATTAAPTTTAPEDTTTTEPATVTTTTAPAGDVDADDESSLPLVIALVAGGLVLAAGIAVVVLRSGAGEEDDAEGDEPDAPGADGGPPPTA